MHTIFRIFAAAITLAALGCGGPDEGFADTGPLPACMASLSCANPCPDGLDVGQPCDPGSGQCCVCTADGLRCSNSQPDCPPSSSDACSFDGQQCQYCGPGGITTYICSGGSLGRVDAPTCI